MAATSIGFTPPIVAQVGRAWVRRTPANGQAGTGRAAPDDTSKVVVAVPPPPSATV